MRTQFLLSAALAALTTASPVLKNRDVTTVTISGTTATSYPQPATEIQGFPIHSSCNGTERNQLEKALEDTIKLARQAANHVLSHGSTSELYAKYFGNASTAEVVGWYEKLIYGDHEGVLFRCDDIDGNCHQEGWGGHWRGSNATDETVICPLSYTTRQPLEALCAEHYADSYPECLELAEEDPAQAVRNTHTLQYFALDVYAMEVALPGEGCTGKIAEVASASASSSAAPAASSASSSAVSSAAATSAASTTASQAATKTSGATAECHTHADGEVHCADTGSATKTTSAGTFTVPESTEKL
ncbi:unnamed protein product [Aureobasidium vineae]|uniref:Putative peptidase domain-containing protein n=1 Tax=Aureobasidium vineae TaxID=2773715 RepID=A0A9N8JKS1_9PEZI|nr:unnamed protein product [Aureobasidium vineae]